MNFLKNAAKIYNIFNKRNPTEPTIGLKIFDAIQTAMGFDAYKKLTGQPTQQVVHAMKDRHDAERAELQRHQTIRMMQMMTLPKELLEKMKINMIVNAHRNLHPQE